MSNPNHPRPTSPSPTQHPPPHQHNKSCAHTKRAWLYPALWASGSGSRKRLQWVGGWQGGGLAARDTERSQKRKKKPCRTPTRHAPLVVFRISGPAPLAVAAEYPTVSLTKATPGVQRTGGGVGGGGAGREGKAQPAVQAGKRDTPKKKQCAVQTQAGRSSKRGSSEGGTQNKHTRVDGGNIRVQQVPGRRSSGAHARENQHSSRPHDFLGWYGDYGQAQLRCTKVPYHTSQLHGAWFIFPLLLQLCKLV